MVPYNRDLTNIEAAQLSKWEKAGRRGELGEILSFAVNPIKLLRKFGRLVRKTLFDPSRQESEIQWKRERERARGWRLQGRRTRPVHAASRINPSSQGFLPKLDTLTQPIKLWVPVIPAPNIPFARYRATAVCKGKRRAKATRSVSRSFHEG